MWSKPGGVFLIFKIFEEVDFIDKRIRVLVSRTQWLHPINHRKTLQFGENINTLCDCVHFIRFELLSTYHKQVCSWCSVMTYESGQLTL